MTLRALLMLLSLSLVTASSALAQEPEEVSLTSGPHAAPLPTERPSTALRVLAELSIGAVAMGSLAVSGCLLGGGPDEAFGCLVGGLGTTFEYGVCMPPVREGQRCDSNIADLDVGENVGCAPCERGTWCLHGHPLGFTDVGTRCYRLCDDAAGNADEGQCACGNEQCVPWGFPAEPEDAAGNPIGRHFCKPCIANNVAPCDGEYECCDSEAACQTVAVVGLEGASGTTELCCRTIGTDCAHDRQCCPGSRCQSGECTACGREGANAAEIACCPGLVVLTTSGGQICASCHDIPHEDYACSDEFLLVEDSSGIRDPLPIGESESVIWTSFIGRGTTGGNLTNAWKDAVLARYALNERHRAFLFSNLLTTGVAEGDHALWLPRNDPPESTREIEGLPMSDVWQSMRVYDSGRCSYLVTWQDLATVISAALMTELSRVDAASNVLHMNTSVAPVLRSEPRHPELGPERALDEVRLVTRLQADLPCGDEATVTLQPGFRLTSVSPGYNTPTSTQARDEELGSVGCEPDDLSDGWRCRLPESATLNPFDAGDGSGPVVEIVIFPNPEVEDVIEVNALEDHAGCTIQTDRYACELPRWRWGNTVTPPLDPEQRVFYANMPDLEYPRVLDYVAHSVDLDLIPIIDEDALGHEAVVVEGCGLLNGAAEGIIEDAIRDALPKLRDTLADAVGRIVGTSATSDFGVPFGELLFCTNDADCRVSHGLGGGRRHSCNVTMERCDELRIEVRRVNIRPDGIELVFAEGTLDPQYPLVSVRPVSRTGDRTFCDPSRATNDSGNPIDLQIASASSLVGTALLCEDSAVGCVGICPQIGAPCAFASALGALRIPAGSTCSGGRCCPIANVCGGQCRDFETDEANCGFCGNACEPGFVCVGGACDLP